MNIFKQGLFALFLNLKPFFTMAYPLMLSLSMLGVGLGILLMVTPSEVQEYSQFISLFFTLVCTYLVMVKRHYSQVLAWADTRKSQVVISIKKTSNDTY